MYGLILHSELFLRRGVGNLEHREEFIAREFAKLFGPIMLNKLVFEVFLIKDMGGQGL